MMKRIIIAFIIVCLITSITLAAPRYIAGMLRKPFHNKTCTWAKKISPLNAAYYATQEEAIKDGNIPCKICKP